MNGAMAKFASGAGLKRLGAGLSLVELLISMALGVFLAGGTVSVYLAGKQQFLFEDQQARLQENGRYATRLMRRELALAGFYGGLSPLQRPPGAVVGVDCNSSGWALATAMPLELVDNHSGSGVPTTGSSTQLTCVDGSSVVTGSDLLAVKRTASRASVLAGDPAPGITASSVERWFMKTRRGLDATWEKARPADFFRAGALNPEDAYWQASARVLFLRNYSTYPDDGLPTLCMEELAGDAMSVRCLVEGVEDLQLEFGIDGDRDGVPERYRSSLSAADLSNVRAVRAHLLLRTPQPLPGHIDNKTYFLGVKEIRPPMDAYMRRVFSTTVSLRNAADTLMQAALR